MPNFVKDVWVTIGQLSCILLPIALVTIMLMGRAIEERDLIIKAYRRRIKQIKEDVRKLPN